MSLTPKIDSDISIQNQHPFHQRNNSASSMNMVQNGDLYPYRSLGQHGPQGLQLTNEQRQHKIFNISVPQSSSYEDISILSFESATGRCDFGRNDHNDDGTTTTLLVQTCEGATEQLALPRSAADIVFALKEEVNTLKQELESLKSSRQSIQPIQDIMQIANCTSSTKPTCKVSKKKTKADKVGRWSLKEHRLFLKGMKLHGRRWTKVATIVKTRTDLQVRTHAQKYFQKLARENRQDGEELDDATIDRLAELDLQSSPPKSNTKKGRYANKRKMPSTSAGSASSVSDGKIDTSIGSCPEKEGKRHASEASNASGSHTSYPTLFHLGDNASNLPSPEPPVPQPMSSLDDYHLISNTSDSDVGHSSSSSLSSIYPLVHPNGHSCGWPFSHDPTTQLVDTTCEIGTEAINWLLSDV